MRRHRLGSDRLSKLCRILRFSTNGAYHPTARYVRERKKVAKVMESSREEEVALWDVHARGAFLVIFVLDELVRKVRRIVLVSRRAVPASRADFRIAGSRNSHWHPAIQVASTGSAGACRECGPMVSYGPGDAIWLPFTRRLFRASHSCGRRSSGHHVLKKARLPSIRICRQRAIRSGILTIKMVLSRPAPSSGIRVLGVTGASATPSL